MRADLRHGPECGSGPRGRTRLALAASLVLFGVQTGEPGAALPAATLFLPLGRLLRRPAAVWGTAAAALAFLALCLVRGGPGLRPERLLGLTSGLVLAAAFQRSRLAPLDHLLLLAGGVVPAGIGALHAGPLFLPLLALWLPATLFAVVAVQAREVEERVLDAARIRGPARATAPEIGGRAPAGGTGADRTVAMLSFAAFALGLLLAWVVPRAVSAMGAAFAPAEEPAPEVPPVAVAEDGTPIFDIPDEEACSMPFGPRLTRAAFVKRLGSDGLTVLIRTVSGSPVTGSRLLVRGECYDTFDSAGEWVRARGEERSVYDAEDGEADGSVRLGAGESFTGEYAVPRGFDRTLYTLADAAVFPGAPLLGRDGSGNLFHPKPTAPPRPYLAASGFRQWRDEPLADPGPEFLLVPESLRGLSLHEVPLAEGADDAGAVEVLAAAMRTGFLRLERDAAPGQVEVAAPDHFDPSGFLLGRRWGRNGDFATAFAIVLRNAGVPCRLATGYRDGAWFDEGDFYVFSAGDTFAWVEVPVEGLGWVAVDPTPAAMDVLGEEKLAEVFEKEPEDRPDEAQKSLAEGPEAGGAGGWVRGVEDFLLSLLPASWRGGVAGRILVWLGLLLFGGLLLALLLAAGESGARFLHRAVERARGGADLPPFYARLLAALRRHGLSRRRAETPLQFARTAFLALGPGFEAVRDLTAAFCALRYGGRPLPAEREQALLLRVARVEEGLAERRPGRGWRAGLARRGAVLGLLLLLGGAGGPGDPVARLGERGAAERAAARAELLAGGAASLPALVAEVAGIRRSAVPPEVAALVAMLDDDRFEVRESAERRLVAMGAAAVPALEEAVRSGSPEARRRAARALAAIGPEAPPGAASAPLRRRQALALLGLLGGAGEVEPVVAAGLGEPRDMAIAREALAGIARRSPEAVLDVATRGHRAARGLAIAALGRSGAEVVRARLLALATDPDPETRAAAGTALLSPADAEETARAREGLAAGEAAGAEALVRGVLARCPGYPEAAAVLGGLLAAAGRTDEALAVLEGSRLPPVEVLSRGARSLRAAGRPEEALQRVEAAREMGRGRTDLLLLWAEILLQTDPPRPEFALSRAEEAAGEAPGLAAPLGVVARILGDYLGDREGAAEACRAAWAREPADPQWLDRLRHYLAR